MSTSAIIENMTNTSVNMTSSSYVVPFTEDWVIASTVILAIFLVFGITANSITIAVIQKSPKLRNRYYVILSSLCVSDIISALVSVLFLYRRVWGFLYFAWPEFFCRLYWGVDLWTSFSTAFHILSFAILRLIGVRWPTKFRQISKRHMTIWLFSIWFSTFCFGFIPHFIFNTARVIDRENQPEQARWASCSLAEEWISIWQDYIQFAYSVFLYIPALSIIGISIAITIILRKRVPPGISNATPFTSVSGIVENKYAQSTESISLTPSNSRPASLAGPTSNTSTPVLQPNKRLIASRKLAMERRWKKDKRAILQLFLIVGSFFLGYIPLTAFHFYTGFTITQSDTVTNAIDWRFAMVQYILLRFSECLNPIFYNLSSRKMREETKLMLVKAFRRPSKFNINKRQTYPPVKSSSDI